jgi:hypothetical protein
MAVFLYAVCEMLAWLLFLAMSFGAVLLALLAGVVLDEGLRSVVLSLKSHFQALSARKRTDLHPAMADRRNC